MAPLVMSVIGYINMDLAMIATRVPDLGESLPARGYNASPGGKASNAAIAAFRSVHNKVEDTDDKPRFESPYDDTDIEVRVIGAVGKDDYGARAINNLQMNGVNASGVRISETVPTGVCFITIEDRSRDIRALFYTGATSTLTRTDFPTAESLGHGVRPDLIVSQLEMGRSTVEHIMKLAHEERIDFMLNAAPAQVLLMDHYRYITHLVVNETEAATLLGMHVDEVVESRWDELVQAFLEMGVQNVVITLGAQGAYYANGQDRGHVPAEKVKVVDAAGAGYIYPDISYDVVWWLIMSQRHLRGSICNRIPAA